MTCSNSAMGTFPLPATRISDQADLTILDPCFVRCDRNQGKVCGLPSLSPLLRTRQLDEARIKELARAARTRS